VAAPASADEAYNPSCGSGQHLGVNGPNNLVFNGSGNNWTITFQADCGGGKTVEWEMQKSNDGTHWVDMNNACCGAAIDNIWTASSTGTHNVSKTFNTASNCAFGWLYRAQTWDAFNPNVESPILDGDLLGC
jgi:hypothetical protein